MKKLRLSLIAASAVCAVAASAMTFTSVAAADDYREVTLTGTNVFYAGAGGAQISVHRFTEDSDYTDYTSFIIGEDQTVAFRKNLAYSWYALNESDVVEHNAFSMEIGFTELNFESYVIRFQSQQYNITEDGVTENYLVFIPDPDGDNLNLYVSETEEIADDETAHCCA